MATTRKKKEIFTTGSGMKIELKRIDPVFLQSVISSVKMPERPKYEAKTISGRTEYHVMDEESAKQTEGGEKLWADYQDEMNRATGEQTERSLRALFLDGTVRPKGAFVDHDWEKRMRIIGVDVPSDPDELWVMYLMMSLNSDDIIRMSSHIMRLTGVDEEVIQQAEDSFRDSSKDSSE